MSKNLIKKEISPKIRLLSINTILDNLDMI